MPTVQTEVLDWYWNMLHVVGLALQRPEQSRRFLEGMIHYNTYNKLEHFASLGMMENRDPHLNIGSLIVDNNLQLFQFQFFQ